MVVYAVFVVLVILGIWALVDAIIRPRAAFESAGRRKARWLGLLIAGLPLDGPSAGVLGAIHLMGVHPAVKPAAPSS
jgi:hypothetical protein